MNDHTDFTYSSDIINVVEEYDYDTQCEQYNRYFKHWRENKQCPFAFNFEMNKKESVYIEGRGFKVPSLADAESEVIGHIMNIVGIAMLIWTFIDNILGKVIIQLLDRLGLNIHCSLLTTAIYGGDPILVVGALIMISAIKTVAPVIYLNIKLKMPKEVRFLNVMNHPGELIRSIAWTIAIGTVTCLPLIYTSNTSQLYSYFSTLDADIAAWGQAEFIAYTIYDLFFLSFLTTLFFNGAVFSALRQFGDSFAIGITAMIAGLLAQDLKEIPSALFITIIASAGVLRSGSIYTAFFVRVIYKMYILAIYVIEVADTNSLELDRNLFMISAFVVSMIVVGLSQILINRRKCYSVYLSEVPQTKRIRFAVRAYPFPAVALLCILAAVMKQVF